MSDSSNLARRDFLRHAAVGAAAAGPLATAALSTATAAEAPNPMKMRVGLIGCESVSNIYLPNLTQCRYVELVSVCDITPERSLRQAERFKVPNHYPHIDAMLAGAAFDLLVNTTDMQEHGRLNHQAVLAGKHVWSEKPMAGGRG